MQASLRWSDASEKRPRPSQPDKPGQLLEAQLHRAYLPRSIGGFGTEAGDADLGADVGGKDAGSRGVFKKDAIRGEQAFQMFQPLFDFSVKVGHQTQDIQKILHADDFIQVNIAAAQPLTSVQAPVQIRHGRLDQCLLNRLDLRADTCQGQPVSWIKRLPYAAGCIEFVNQSHPHLLPKQIRLGESLITNQGKKRLHHRFCGIALMIL